LEVLCLLVEPLLMPARPGTLFDALGTELLKEAGPALYGFYEMLYIVICCCKNFCIDC